MKKVLSISFASLVVAIAVASSVSATPSHKLATLGACDLTQGTSQFGKCVAGGTACTIENNDPTTGANTDCPKN